MKLKFLIIFAIFFALVSCYSDDIDSPIEIVTESSVTITVSGNGFLHYEGEGEFKGVVLELNNRLLRNKKITIDKIDPPAESNGYFPLSNAYRISIEDDGASVGVNFTFPYDTQLLKGANITESEIAVLTYVDGASSRNYTEINENNTVRSFVYLPATIYAGYKKEVQLADKAKSLITLKYISRDMAKKRSQYFIDPSGNYIYDTVKGLANVQLGEKILLSVDNRSVNSQISDILWSLSKKPLGSTADLTVINNNAQIIPDKFGLYTASVKVMLLDGKILEESINLWGLGYSRNLKSDEIICFDCHDGSYGYGANFYDIYGRKVLRDITSHWEKSAHFQAFDSVSEKTDPLCFQCHTTGYFFPDRNSDGADDYPNVYGYDDLITDWDNTVSEGNKHLRGVTCEACHGPTYIYEDGIETGRFAYHPASFSITSGVCLACHDSEEKAEAEGHIFKYKNIHEKSHVVAESNIVDNKPCFDCHTGEGYLSKLNGVERNVSDFSSINGVGCPVCHDPHGETGNKSQLRKVGNATLKLKSADMIINVRSAAMCYDCHSAGEPLPAIGKIPHNTQAEMLEGVGGYDYTEEIESSMHNILSDRCVGCHMRAGTGDNLNVNHEFSMKESVNDRLTYCNSTCHKNINVPNDFDYKGRISEIKTLLQQLKTEINSKAGLPENAQVSSDYSGYNLTAELIDALNKAAYNYHFIVNDRSFGAHNYLYTKGLLEASLNDLVNF